MPLYEYQCRDCGHRFEVLQRMGAGAEGLDCPSCGDERLEKLLSSFSASSSNGGSAAASATTGAGCGAPACGTGFT